VSFKFYLLIINTYSIIWRQNSRRTWQRANYKCKRIDNGTVLGNRLLIRKLNFFPDKIVSVSAKCDKYKTWQIYFYQSTREQSLVSDYSSTLSKFELFRGSEYRSFEISMFCRNSALIWLDIFENSNISPPSFSRSNCLEDTELQLSPFERGILCLEVHGIRCQCQARDYQREMQKKSRLSTTLPFFLHERRRIQKLNVSRGSDGRLALVFD